MLDILERNRLTVHFQVPISEPVTLQRITSYFFKANYKQLYDEIPLLKFERAIKLNSSYKDMFFGRDQIDPNNQYSLVRLVVEPVDEYTNINAMFRGSFNTYFTYYTQEILKREIESFKKALFEDAFTPVYIKNPMRLLWVSVIKLLLELLIIMAIFLAIVILLLNYSELSTIGNLMLIFLAAIVSLCLGIFYVIWRKKKMEKMLSDY